MVSHREGLVLLARVAEQAGRYEDTLGYMNEVVSAVSEGSLTIEERTLLSNTYKTLTGRLRRAWRTICALEANEAGEANKLPSPVLQLIRREKTAILGQLSMYCCRILEHVEQCLLPNAKTPEDKVFYYKINGDYQRYLAESAVGEARKSLVSKSLEGYTEAWQIADSQLSATDTTRLGLALNFSVFYYELLDSPNRACHLAKYAFDAALETLDDLPEEEAPETVHVLQLLQGNLSLWLEQMEIFPPEQDQKESELEQAAVAA